MFEYAKLGIIVGGPDNPLRSTMVNVLATEFNAKVQTCETFDALLGKFKAGNNNSPWQVVVLCEGLVENHQYGHVYLALYARILRSLSQSVILFCIFAGEDPACFSITGQDETQDPKPNGTLIELSPSASSEALREVMINGFSKVLKQLPTPPRAVYATTDLAFVEQVRALHPDRSFESGRRILEYLAIRFFDCDEIEITKLAQGFSGANVFRILPKKNGSGENEYALKLDRLDNASKITLEIAGQKSAQETLGVPGITRHIPNLIKPRIPANPSGLDKDVSYLKDAAYFGNWLALCYDFLGGGRFGRFIDLETALITSPEDLKERVSGTSFDTTAASIDEARLGILSTILNWLGNQWYLNKKRNKREKKAIWTTADTPSGQFLTLPPYQLTGKTKQLILSFLDGPASALGERLLEPTWKSHREMIWKLMNTGGPSTGFGKLDTLTSVILSPCHGDLNANNVLLWLEQPGFPFLIDLPFFQSQGHALQDLARIEIEIKFSIMDRQRIVSPPGPEAYEHTYSQLKLWKEMEDHLLLNPCPGGSRTWENPGSPNNVALSLRFLSLVRKKAIEVQEQPDHLAPPPPFYDEYLPALLFYTLRAISFPSLSIFKRLLATYSAGRILEHLT